MRRCISIYILEITKCKDATDKSTGHIVMRRCISIYILEITKCKGAQGDSFVPLHKAQSGIGDIW
jgi:hypothetical protein